MPDTPAVIEDFGALSILGGTCHVADLGTAAPTATGALGNAWAEIGRYNEDGWTASRARTTTQHKDQYGEIAMEVVTDSGLTFKIKFIETSKLAREMYNHTQVAADGSQVIVPSAPGKRRAFCFTAIMADADGNQFVERHFVPLGQVVETEEAPRKNGELATYGITVRAFPSNSIKDTGTGLDGSAKVTLAAAPTA